MSKILQWNIRPPKQWGEDIDKWIKSKGWDRTTVIIYSLMLFRKSIDENTMIPDFEYLDKEIEEFEN